MVLPEQIKEITKRCQTLERCLDMEHRRIELQNEEEKTLDPALSLIHI